MLLSTYLYVGAPISLILFGWFLYKWRFCTRGSLDPGSVVLFFSGVVAFITSVAWMNIQANELVAVLQTFGTVFDVSLGESCHSLPREKLQADSLMMQLYWV